MKKYTVNWVGSRTERAITISSVEAENRRDVFDKVVAEHKHSSHPRIYVYRGLGFFEHEEFDNPHYVEPQKAVAEKVKESRPEQPTKPDGSVSWYENLGESVLSDRDILLAQLHELRTIKRCVVCTIIIVIVIPIAVGVIASA